MSVSFYAYVFLEQKIKFPAAFGKEFNKWMNELSQLLVCSIVVWTGLILTTDQLESSFSEWEALHGIRAGNGSTTDHEWIYSDLFLTCIINTDLGICYI